MRRIEFVSALTLVIASVCIALVDLFDIGGWSSVVSERISTFSLLCIGLVASYLVFDRRGKLQEIEFLVDHRTAEILKTIGLSVEEFRSSGEWAEAMASRINRAKQVDDVSWAELSAVIHRWSQADRDAHRRCNETVSRVIRDPKVVWREIVVFDPSDSQRLKDETKNILDKKAVGYNLAYFDHAISQKLPKIGGFMTIDRDSQDAEVFLANSDSTMWLRMKHPVIVRYFTDYFEILWHESTKLKTGPDINMALLKSIEKSHQATN